MSQCYLCIDEQSPDKTLKPCADYFFCTCKRDGYWDNELENWYDKMCNHCSLEKNVCVTCGRSEMENDTKSIEHYIGMMKRMYVIENQETFKTFLDQYGLELCEKKIMAIDVDGELKSTHAKNPELITCPNCQQLCSCSYTAVNEKMEDVELCYNCWIIYIDSLP